MARIRKSGGYRKLASFQTATIIYDATVWFCEKFLDERRTRTVDQMVQAARSGRQNIAEGSRAGATSSQTELRLVNVARSSQEELLLDYEDYLRHRRLPQWAPDSPEATAVRSVASRWKSNRTNRTDQSDLAKPDQRARTDRTDLDQSDRTDRSDLDRSDRTNRTVLAKSDRSDLAKPDQTNRTDLAKGSSTNLQQRELTELTDQERWDLYSPWLDHDDPVVRVNAVICLIHQANYLLDQQIDALEEQFIDEGGYSEQLATARLQKRAELRKQGQAAASGDGNESGEQTQTPPECPACGGLMALRTAKSGRNTGSQFWGCANYPQCKGTSQV
jgi:restriction system protein